MAGNRSQKLIVVIRSTSNESMHSGRGRRYGEATKRERDKQEKFIRGFQIQ